MFGVCCEGIPQQVNVLIDEAVDVGKGANNMQYAACGIDLSSSPRDRSLNSGSRGAPERRERVLSTWQEFVQQLVDRGQVATQTMDG